MALTMRCDDLDMAYVMNRIDEYAHGRIRDLRVRHDHGQLVLEGTARCFHDKLRAQEAAFSASRFIGPIANRIEVAD